MQDLLDCLPSPQYPKFLSQFRQHDANSQVMKPDVSLHNQKSRKMVGRMEENGVCPFSGQIGKLKTTTNSQVSDVQKGVKTGHRRVAWDGFPRSKRLQFNSEGVPLYLSNPIGARLPKHRGVQLSRSLSSPSRVSHKEKDPGRNAK